jgi:ribulose-5-phosphate 4-epimerase/fuculose-1-phosphate aldolase
MEAHDARTRESIVALGRSIFERGLTFGRTGNLSTRAGDRILITPTSVSLGRLSTDDLSIIGLDGSHLDGPKPSKEAFLHSAMYRVRPTAGAVVHLHSTHAAAVSCLAVDDRSNVLPPLTAYYVMRVGRLPLLPYHAPGDPALGPAAEAAAWDHHALLLANHGPIVAGVDLDAAADAIEELEETARLFLLLRGMATSPLTVEQQAALTPTRPAAALQPGSGTAR